MVSFTIQSIVMQYPSQFEEYLELSGGADAVSATASLPVGAGVCLLCGREGEPILLLFGAQLRAMVRRRLLEAAPGEKNRRADLKSITTGIWYRRCWSAFETQWAYYQIAREIYPDRLPEFFPRLSAWFLQIRMEDRYPGFRVTENYAPKNGLHWGPFSSKQAAGDCLEILEELFSLCRCLERLSRSPQEEPCSYGQIRRCRSVCTGRVAMEEYRRVLEQAIAFLDRPTEESVRGMRQRMKNLAVELRFEEAQRLKGHIKLAERMDSDLTRWVGRMDSFYLFSFQGGPPMSVEGKRRRQPGATGFLIGPGWVKSFAPAVLPELERRCGEMLEAYRRERNALAESFSEAEAAVLGWTSNYLYRNQREQGFFVRVESVPDAGELAKGVRNYFSNQRVKSKKPRLDTASLTEDIGLAEPETT